VSRGRPQPRSGLAVHPQPPYRIVIDGQGAHDEIAGPFPIMGRAIRESLSLVRSGRRRLVVLDANDDVCIEAWPIAPSLGGAAWGHHHPRPKYAPKRRRAV